MSHIFNALSKLDKYDIAFIILTVHCLHLNEKILFIHLFTQNVCGVLGRSTFLETVSVGHPRFLDMDWEILLVEKESQGQETH